MEHENMEKRKRKIYKIILLGDGGVGKTCLVNTYFNKAFVGNYKMTLGADFSIKKYKSDIIQIWDLAGQPTFSSIRRTYYVGGVGAFILFDVTNRRTYNNVMNWVEELIANSRSKVPIFLIGNKIDLISQKPDSITPSEGEALKRDIMEKHGLHVEFISTSAKTGLNINEIFEKFVEWVNDPQKKFNYNKLELQSTTIVKNPTNNGNEQRNSKDKSSSDDEPNVLPPRPFI